MQGDDIMVWTGSDVASFDQPPSPPHPPCMGSTAAKHSAQQEVESVVRATVLSLTIGIQDYLQPPNVITWFELRLFGNFGKLQDCGWIVKGVMSVFDWCNCISMKLGLLLLNLRHKPCDFKCKGFANIRFSIAKIVMFICFIVTYDYFHYMKYRPEKLRTMQYSV